MTSCVWSNHVVKKPSSERSAQILLSKSAPPPHPCNQLSLSAPVASITSSPLFIMVDLDTYCTNQDSWLRESQDSGGVAIQNAHCHMAYKNLRFLNDEELVQEKALKTAIYVCSRPIHLYGRMKQTTTLTVLTTPAVGTACILCLVASV